MFLFGMIDRAVGRRQPIDFLLFTSADMVKAVGGGRKRVIPVHEAG